MTHVRLVGPDGDGRNLVVATADGERFSLPVTDELKALVTEIEAPDGTRVPFLPPREIQRRLRAGFTCEDLSRLSGVPVESIRKYEEPILAERAFIVELAKAARLGHGHGSPIMGELVMDRLASKGVPGASVAWDAWRIAGMPWRVAIAYSKGGKTIQATWTFDHHTKTIIGEDAESRWLTETDIVDAPMSPRHLAPVGDPVVPKPTVLRPVEPTPPTPDPIEIPQNAVGLLEELDAKRGVREPAMTALDEEDDEEFEGFGPLELRKAGAGGSGGVAGSGGASVRPQPARRHRGGRASVPKWDEIVFGATTD